MIETIVIGHLGQDAHINDVNGKKVINFSLAHSEKYKDRDGQNVGRTVWIDCAYWTDRTNIAQYLTKGTQVFVRGIPTIHQYRTRDGQPAASFKLRIDTVKLLGSKNAGEGNTNTPVADPYGTGETTIVDDLPF